jgi:hypothetical protein
MDYYSNIPQSTYEVARTHATSLFDAELSDYFTALMKRLLELADQLGVTQEVYHVLEASFPKPNSMLNEQNDTNTPFLQAEAKPTGLEPHNSNIATKNEIEELSANGSDIREVGFKDSNGQAMGGPGRESPALLEVEEAPRLLASLQNIASNGVGACRTDDIDTSPPQPSSEREKVDNRNALAARQRTEEQDETGSENEIDEIEGKTVRMSKRKRTPMDDSSDITTHTKLRPLPFPHPVVSSLFHPDLSMEQLTELRDQFHSEVSQLEKENGQRLFCTRDAIAITKFFFVDFFGRSAERIDKLKQLCSNAAKRKRKMDVCSVHRARQIIQSDANLPHPIKEFLSVYEFAVEASNGTHNSQYATLNEIFQHINLRKQYDILTNEAQHNPCIQEWLESKGKQTVVGRGYATLVKQFLTEELGLKDEKEFQHQCSKATGVMNLTDRFGMGIIGVLPNNAMWRQVTILCRSNSKLTISKAKCMGTETYEPSHTNTRTRSAEPEIYV